MDMSRKHLFLLVYLLYQQKLISTIRRKTVTDFIYALAHEMDPKAACFSLMQWQGNIGWWNLERIKRGRPIPQCYPGGIACAGKCHFDHPRFFLISMDDDIGGGFIHGQ